MRPSPEPVYPVGVSLPPCRSKFLSPDNKNQAKAAHDKKQAPPAPAVGKGKK